MPEKTQEKIQVNQVLHEFSRYGILLFLFAIFFFGQIFMQFIYPYIISLSGYVSNSSTMILLIKYGPEMIIDIFGIIIVLILMLKAIRIHSKANEPALNLFRIFSILWFAFFLIENILIIWYYLIIFDLGYTVVFAKIFTWVLYITGILSIIFQLCAWISLRKFFLDRRDLLPIENNRNILNFLVYLMIIMSISIFLWGCVPIPTDFLGITILIDGLIYNYILNILLIIGYSLLGYKLRKLKVSKDTTIPER